MSRATKVLLPMGKMVLQALLLMALPRKTGSEQMVRLYKLNQIGRALQ
jgi:hypothetical protein